jgi:hypothetical protein
MELSKYVELGYRNIHKFEDCYGKPILLALDNPRRRVIFFDDNMSYDAPTYTKKQLESTHINPEFVNLK